MEAVLFERKEDLSKLLMIQTGESEVPTLTGSPPPQPKIVATELLSSSRPTPPLLHPSTMPSRKGFIWPKDPLPGRPRRGLRGRLRDTIYGLGPDIYVGRLDTRHATPKTSTWSHWADRHQTPLEEYLRTFTVPGTVWGSQRGRHRYDYRTRKYVNVDKVVADGMAGGPGQEGVWSYVEYCDDPTCNNRMPVEWVDGGGHWTGNHWAHDHDHAQNWGNFWAGGW